MFEAKASVEAGRVVVALAGDCDLAVRQELTAVLLDAVRSADVVVVDLAEVEFMDSSGVHALVEAHHAAVAGDRRLYVQHAVGVAAQVLAVTGVGELLSPPAADAAVASDTASGQVVEHGDA
jgi:anti-anti-sigma factor